jgi:hypothetical protein
MKPEWQMEIEAGLPATAINLYIREYHRIHGNKCSVVFAYDKVKAYAQKKNLLFDLTRPV